MQNKDSITFNKNSFNEMKKKVKRVYVTPESKVYAMQTEQFLCNSITPKTSTSSENSWDEDQEYESGNIFIGNGNDIAP